MRIEPPVPKPSSAASCSTVGLCFCLVLVWIDALGPDFGWPVPEADRFNFIFEAMEEREPPPSMRLTRSRARGTRLKVSSCEIDETVR